MFINNYAYFSALPLVHSPEPSLNALPRGLNGNVPRFLGLQVEEPNGHSQELRHTLFFYSWNKLCQGPIIRSGSIIRRQGHRYSYGDKPV